MFENPRRGRQARNFTTNAPKILDLKSSSEQIFSRKLPLAAPAQSLRGLKRTLRSLRNSWGRLVCSMSIKMLYENVVKSGSGSALTFKVRFIWIHLTPACRPAGRPGQYFQSPSLVPLEQTPWTFVLIYAVSSLFSSTQAILCWRSIFFLLVQSNLTCMWFEVAANKNHTIFRDARGIRES